VSSRPRLIRLVVVPALLFLAFAGTAFGLAKAHLASPGAPAAAGTVAVGDPYNGETVFQQSCAACHGAGGKGGGVGPRLAGAQISLAAAQAQIDNGGGVMPAGIVTGAKEHDVLAYLATILAKP
jgi:mono/diheme cytochrome c family protein